MRSHSEPVHDSDDSVKLSEIALESELPADYAEAVKRAHQRERDDHKLAPVLYDFSEYLGDE
jgi:hypothetical protein